MLNSLYNWYLKTFLPFEDPSHPLHHSTYEPEPYDGGEEDEYDAGDLIGQNYSRKPFSKPATYKKWGDKWYKEG